MEAGGGSGAGGGLSGLLYRLNLEAPDINQKRITGVTKSLASVMLILFTRSRINTITTIARVTAK